MASLKLGSAEFDDDTPNKPRKSPGVVKKMRGVSKDAAKLYKKYVTPHRTAILIVLGVGAAVTSAALAGTSFWEARQERREQIERTTQEKQTPKSSLKLSVKAKHDGTGRLANFNIHEDKFEVDGCPIGTHKLEQEKSEIVEIGQGIYNLTVTLKGKAHGSVLRYRFSFDIDDKTYDFMPVEATLVQ